MPPAQLASRLTPARMADRGRRRGRRDPVHLPVRAHRLGAQLHDAGERRRTVADGQDDAHAQPAGHQLPAPEQRHRDRRAVQPDGQGARRARRRGAARQHPARASRCSKNRTSAKATSSSRSPTSARCRGSSRKRSTAFRASPARRSSSCCRAPRTRSSAKARTPPRPPCCCPDTSLAPSSVRGIAQLVASSVPGLQLSKVTITDASGQLLWPQAAGGGGGRRQRQPAGSPAALRPEHGGEPRRDARADARAGQGAGARLRQHERRPDDQGIARIRQGRHAPAAEQVDAKPSAATAAARAGVTGTANLAAAAHGAPRQVELQARNHDLLARRLKTVTHSTIAPGTVESQHVSVLLDKSVPASALPAIREAVTNAAGIQAKRGDTISIGQVAFAKSGRRGRRQQPAELRQVRAAGHRARSIFLFFTTRSLRKREKETIDEPVWLRELDAPMRLSELERETSPRGRSGDGRGRAPTAAAGASNGRARRAAATASAHAGRAARRQPARPRRPAAAQLDAGGLAPDGQRARS